MPSTPTNEQIELFRSLFRGREDVFAIRWQKGKKSGYMPAYRYDPYLYRIHKMKGGTFQNYPDKTYRKLTDEEIQKHLSGEQFIGIYPLLQDNTSWFIVADFDKESWVEECQKLIRACNEANVPAYLERSQSGNGGHIWIFFEQPYSAVKSRKILKFLLDQIGSTSIFEKDSSFDRLFPNQDLLSGKGLGNLIALPLNGQKLTQGDNCFVDPASLQHYPDQWDFLKKLKRVSVKQLDKIFSALSKMGQRSQVLANDRLIIRLDSAIRINRSGLNLELVNFLKEELNFANSAFFIKKQAGKNTWGTKRYFTWIEEADKEIILPRGFIGKLLRFCKGQQLDFTFEDKRCKQDPTTITCDLNARPHQEMAINAARNKEFGVIVAPPGSGKTVTALKIISEKQQPALIIVHRKQLFEQWMDSIEAFLGIPRKEIGKIGQGRHSLGKQITVAMIQSLAKKVNKIETNDLVEAFGILIVDECHHIPANTYSATVSKFNSYYQYGLTATPFRKYSDGRLIFAQLGEIIAEIEPEQIETFKRARVVIRNTEFDVPFNPKTDPFETLSKILIHDTARNKLILRDVIGELNKGKKVVIITERREHIDTLHQMLKQSFEVITLSGVDSESTKKAKWKLLKAGQFQAVITTGQFFGEGTDLQSVSRLFLVYPFSFKGRLIQYIGRVQRGEIRPVVYDYRDQKVNYLDRLFLNRNKYYRHLDKQASLFEDQEMPLHPGKVIRIDENISYPLKDLTFLYGAVAFTLSHPKTNQSFDFEIEHDYIRPEFEVLKPYFSKQIGLNKVSIEIHVELEDGQLVAQSASSSDLEKINRELIEGMKFRFFEDTLIDGGSSMDSKSNLLDIGQVQGADNVGKLYGSADELLDAILKNKASKHYRHIRFLADRHQGSVLKLRFVLQPFSLIFLLEGRHQYHLVLETLDTEEATYVWHLERDRKLLPEKLKAIDEELSIIKNKGRKAYLETNPRNFSCIIHNYSNERKGFVIWRDLLEEKLY